MRGDREAALEAQADELLAGSDGIYTERQMRDRAERQTTFTDLESRPHDQAPRQTAAEGIEWDPTMLFNAEEGLHSRRVLRVCLGDIEDPRERRILLARARGESQRTTAQREGISHQHVSRIALAACAKVAEIAVLYGGVSFHHPFLTEVRHKAGLCYRHPTRVWKRRGADPQLALSIQRDRGERLLIFIDIPPEDG